MQMGATGGSVNLDRFADEVQTVFNKIAAFQPRVQVTAYEGWCDDCVPMLFDNFTV